MIRRLSAAIIEIEKAKRRAASNSGLAQEALPPCQDAWDRDQALLATQDREQVEISLNGDGEC